MKIVVVGGSGLIGSKLVRKLREHGHQAVHRVAAFTARQVRGRACGDPENAT